MATQAVERGLAASLRRGGLDKLCRNGCNLQIAPPARHSSNLPYPKMPHSKELLERKRELPTRRWPSFNSPALVPKFLRHAERTARELGVLDEIAAFDEAAAAFPNPTPIYAAT